MPPCPDDLLPPPQSHAAAPWLWLGLLAGVLVIDLALMRSGQPTLSQWVQHQPRWFKVTALVGVGLLGWHLVWGF